MVAKSLAAPSGFGGHLLYLREDLLHRFAAGRRLVWFIWGERGIRPLGHEPPEWLVKILRSGENVWRQVRGAEELISVIRIAAQAPVSPIIPTTLGSSSLDARCANRWVLCTCGVPHFGVFMVFLRFAFS